MPLRVSCFLLLAVLGFACSGHDGERADGQVVGFVEVSEQVGLDFVHDPGVDGSYFMPESIGSGGAFLDYDNDGDLDIYLVNSGPHSERANGQTPAVNRLYRQEADGTFTDVTERSGLGDAGYGMGVAVADIDNDGYVDVYLTNYGPDALYRNNGDGTFTNITGPAGISNPEWGTSAAFLDYDLDGDLDLYVANYVAYDPNDICTDRSGRPDYCGPDGFPGVPDVLYRNNGDGTFTDVSQESSIASGASKGLGVTTADFNHDGWPDLYVANDERPNHLWLNQGDGTFVDEALKLGAALNELGRTEAGMGVAIGDAENDGDLDLFITHLRTESNTLYRYGGEYGYHDDTINAGLAGPSLPYTGFGTGFFDYDLDGDLDLAVVNGRVSRGPLLAENADDYWAPYAEPNQLFENTGEGKFELVPPEATAFSQFIENSRGLAFGDVDNDGDLDLLVCNEGGPARLFRNEVDRKGNWLVVRVVDPTLKRDVYGAQVVVQAGARRWTRVISPAYSYLSSNDPRAHFGLGRVDSVEALEVIWPGGSRSRYPGMPANQFLLVEKGNPDVRLVSSRGVPKG